LKDNLVHGTDCKSTQAIVKFPFSSTKFQAPNTKNIFQLKAPAGRNIYSIYYVSQRVPEGRHIGRLKDDLVHGTDCKSAPTIEQIPIFKHQIPIESPSGAKYL
jgi:hypothetical protein